MSLSFSDPSFGKLYANLGRAVGQDDDNVFAIIWNRPSSRKGPPGEGQAGSSISPINGVSA